MTRQPWRRICRGTVWATLPGSREAPTTAIVMDWARISFASRTRATLQRLVDLGRLQALALGLRERAGGRTAGQAVPVAGDPLVDRPRGPQDGPGAEHRAHRPPERAGVLQQHR